MQKFLILGCERSGTHRIADFLYKNLKVKFNLKKYKNIYRGFLKEDTFIKKNKFYIFKPTLEQKFTAIQKKVLLKKKVLMTHKLYKDIFFDFKDYNLILTIRDPISVINDLIKISSPQNNEKTIFIWPEGILPDISKDQLKEYKFLFQNEFNENHILAIGINEIKKDSQIIKYFNSFVIYDHNFEILNSYNKVNLVPLVGLYL